MLCLLKLQRLAHQFRYVKNIIFNVTLILQSLILFCRLTISRKIQSIRRNQMRLFRHYLHTWRQTIKFHPANSELQFRARLASYCAARLTCQHLSSRVRPLCPICQCLGVQIPSLILNL